MKLKREIKIFFVNLADEAVETKEAAKLLAKYSKGVKLTEKEGEALREQFYDIIKVAGIGIPFIMIPGASILLPLIVTFANKYNIDIIPSCFKEKTDDKNTKN